MAKLKSRLHYLLALIIPTFGMTNNILADDEPKAAGSEEKAAEGASGGLSAGAIAAAVAAAAAIAAASDSDSSPAPTVIEEYEISTTENIAISTYTNTVATKVGSVATATREVAAVPAVTGVVTATATASSTSTKGGSVVTDYRYALYGTENQTEDLSSGEYYTDAGFQDADGDDVVYIQVVEETYPEVVTEAEIPATEETYEYDVIVETVTTLPDTIYEEQTTVTTATRTKAGS